MRTTVLLTLVCTAQAAELPLAERVRAEFYASWCGYEIHAWGHDELKPLSETPHDWHAAPLLMTPVDTLDTLILLGFNEEAEKTRQLIVETLSFDKDISVQNSEITIRLLGGLLSAYQLTGDERLLRLADDLGTRLLPAFDFADRNAVSLREYENLRDLGAGVESR